MKKIFIDCGANDGCSIRKFKAIKNDSREYEIHSFECNMELIKKINDKDVFLHSEAVSNKNGKITFYSQNNHHSSSTYREKGEIDRQDFGGTSIIEVDCIRLSDFIMNNFKKDDYIILKLDVEGEEYNIIPDIIETGAYHFLNEIWIEWHSKWINTSNEKDIVYEKFFKSNNIIIDNTWDAIGY